MKNSNKKTMSSTMKKTIKNSNNKEEEKQDKNIILPYSAMEQNINRILSCGRSIILFIGVFPFCPILLGMYSRYINDISNRDYKLILILFTLFELVIMGIYIFKWIASVLTVYLISEDYSLYKLKISVFWYKIRNKMYLINPAGMRIGKISMLFYMVGNIKNVLDTVTEDVTYEEFIGMGRMEKIYNIHDVKNGKKKITFYADVKTKKGDISKKITIMKMYEKMNAFTEYLSDEKARENKSVDFNVKTGIEIMDLLNKSRKEKFLKNSLNITFIMAWVGALTALYKNAFIIWISIETVYLIMVLTDIIIEKNKKK